MVGEMADGCNAICLYVHYFVFILAGAFNVCTCCAQMPDILEIGLHPYTLTLLLPLPTKGCNIYCKYVWKSTLASFVFVNV